MIERRVELTLGETTYHLEPTLDAMRRINADQGSPIEALRRIQVLDFKAVCQVVAAGAAIPSRDFARIEAAIFADGVTKAASAAADLITILLNPRGEEEKTEAAGGKP